jgi:hypothetical protein
MQASTAVSAVGGNGSQISQTSKQQPIPHSANHQAHFVDPKQNNETLHAHKKVSLKEDTLRTLLELNEADNTPVARTATVKTTNITSQNQSSSIRTDNALNSSKEKHIAIIDEPKTSLTLDAADSLLAAASSRKSQRRKKSSSTVNSLTLD